MHHRSLKALSSSARYLVPLLSKECRVGLQTCLQRALHKESVWELPALLSQEDGTIETKSRSWWILLMFIPLVNIVIAAILTIGIATSFRKGAGFGIGLFFLPFIFYPVLGFGDATYKGAAAY